MSAPSVSQIITGVTLQVTSASTPPTVTQTFNDSATLASLKVGIPTLRLDEVMNKLNELKGVSYSTTLVV